MRHVRGSAALSAAILFGALVAHAQEASGERDQKAGAQKTFEAGGKLYDAHHFEEALAAFRASYQIVPSPNSHLMIARCLRDMGRDVEAYREYDSVAREATAKGDRYQSAGQASADEQSEITPKIALLTIKVANPPPGLTVKVGDASIDVAALAAAIPLAPGPAIAVVAEAPDGSIARAEVTPTAGAATEVDLVLEMPAAEPAAPPPPPPVVMTEVHSSPSPMPLRTWSYVAGGVGVVGLATFGIFGAMSSSKYSSLTASCADHLCPPGKQDDIDAGRRDQTIANIGLVLGVVGIGAGATLFILSTSKSKEVHTAALDVKVGPGSVAVDGRF